MARKFLGEKIDPSVDAIRPASMALTSADLMNIPTFRFEDDPVNSENIDDHKYGKRLSRKFGGTMKLKKTLESVPGIFIHDYRKRLPLDRETQFQSKNNSNISGIIVPKVSPFQYGNINKSNNELRPKNLQERRVLQKRISSRKLFDLPELSEVKEKVINEEQSFILDEKTNNDKENFSRHIKNLNDITTSNNNDSKIFQDIISCYSSKEKIANKQQATVFNRELERVLNHVVKIDNMNKMQREFGARDINHLCLPTRINNMPLTPTFNSIDTQSNALDGRNEFMESTPSSSITERTYSLNSPNLSSTIDSNSAYNTALEDFDSSTDLFITKIPSAISDEDTKKCLSQGLCTMSLNVQNNTRRTNQIKVLRLRKIEIKPTIATLDYSNGNDTELKEDDYIISPQYPTKQSLMVHPGVDTIQQLQEKIDHIKLTKQNTILSLSSSVYSER